MAGDFDHLHIKRNTAGSSNELSFDVLDAARTGLDEKAQRAKRSGKTSRSSKGSYHGVKGTSTLGSEAEVVKRKKARRTQTLIIRLILFVVVLLGALALLAIGYRHYLEVQDFTTRFDSLVNQFIEEDEFIAELDTLMGNIDDLSDSDKRAESLEKIPEVITDVERIKSNAQTAAPLVVSDQDKIALTQLLETADSRINMLNVAREMFTLTASRENRANQAVSIWNEVVAEGQETKQVAADANKAATEDEIKAASEATKAVLEKMKLTLAKLQDCIKQDPQIDLASQIAFVETKIKSLEFAVETSDALVAGDRELAAEKNEKYNAEDQKAVALAEKLPLSVGDAVVTAYASKAADLSEQYEKSRNKAIQADAVIRDYLSNR